MAPASRAAVAADGDGGDMVRKAHWAIDKVSADIGDRFSFNTAQSAVHELVTAIQDARRRRLASSAVRHARRRSA